VRSKEKFVMFLLFSMFFATAGMFYYQNVYSKGDEMKDKKLVVIATKDIAKGATFKEGENYGVIALDTKFVFEDYIIYDGENEKELLEGKKAKSPILKNEILSKGRISDEKATEDTFRVFIKPDSKTDVEKGDRVNIYVQIKYKDPKEKSLWYYKTYRIMEDKVVENVVMKKDSRGAEMKVMEYIEIHANEQDSLNYHLADYLTEQKSQIIVLEYKDVFSELESDIKPIEEMEEYEYKKDEFIDNQGDVQVDAVVESEEATKPANEQ